MFFFLLFFLLKFHKSQFSPHATNLLIDSFCIVLELVGILNFIVNLYLGLFFSFLHFNIFTIVSPFASHFIAYKLFKIENSWRSQFTIGPSQQQQQKPGCQFNANFCPLKHVQQFKSGHLTKREDKLQRISCDKFCKLCVVKYKHWPLNYVVCIEFPKICSL